MSPESTTFVTLWKGLILIIGHCALFCRRKFYLVIGGVFRNPAKMNYLCPTPTRLGNTWFMISNWAFKEVWGKDSSILHCNNRGDYLELLKFFHGKYFGDFFPRKNNHVVYHVSGYLWWWWWLCMMMCFPEGANELLTKCVTKSIFQWGAAYVGLFQSCNLFKIHNFIIWTVYFASGLCKWISCL